MDEGMRNELIMAVSAAAQRQRQEYDGLCAHTLSQKTKNTLELMCSSIFHISSRLAHTQHC